MINYREHRGSLEDSLATSRTYNDLIELFDDVKFDSISYYGYDERVNQQLFIVKKREKFTPFNHSTGELLEPRTKLVPIGFVYIQGSSKDECKL